MWRYAKLFGIQVRASALLALQYRVEFAFEAFTIVFWTAAAFAPLLVVFDHAPAIEGWSYHEALLVMGFFLLVKSIFEGAVNPSLLAVVEHVRKGSLDFVLLKPADAQFLVSTTKFEPSAAVGTVGALGFLVWGWTGTGRVLGAAGVAGALVLLAAAVVLLYSFWILVVSAAFYVVRVDNLGYLLGSVLDFGRWPSTIFRGALHVLFTFVIPLALMTTWPAEALLGRLGAAQLAGALAGTAVFAWVCRRLWLAALARYTSASS